MSELLVFDLICIHQSTQQKRPTPLHIRDNNSMSRNDTIWISENFNCRLENDTPSSYEPALLSQRIVPIVKRSAISSGRHSSAVDTGTSILKSRSSIDLISNTIVGSRIQPKNLSIRKDIAAPKGVDVVDSVVDDISVSRHHDDGSQILKYMGVEDGHQVHGSTVEGIGATADEIAVANQSLELAGFVLSE